MFQSVKMCASVCGKKRAKRKEVNASLYKDRATCGENRDRGERETAGRGGGGVWKKTLAVCIICDVTS